MLRLITVHKKNFHQLQKREVEAVYNFFTKYNGFRSVEACAAETGLQLEVCRDVKEYLYRQRRLGLYHFEAGVPPHKYMRDYTLNEFPQINSQSFILEIGPGDNPVFFLQDYPNWYAVDKYFEDGMINFRNLHWAQNKYPAGRIFKGDWERLSEVTGLGEFQGKFDLVVSSHSYEHVFKPIKSLQEANVMLKPGGLLILFVPDGFSDDPSTKDPTHTIYLIPDMVKEFFYYAGGFDNVSVSSFRPNADLIISAIKSGIRE